MEPEKKPEPVKTPAPPKVPQAVEELNVVDIHRKTLFTGRAQKKAEGQAELKDKSKKINRVNLYVKNLDDNIDDERLRNMFSQFGTITSAKVETKDGRLTGVGYVCFSSSEEATKAITEMNKKIVDDKALYVALHQSKEERKAYLASQNSQVDGLGIKEEEQEGAAHTALLDDNASSFKQARPKQEDERMTEATTSRHKSNYIKIAMVLLDVSTRAVRVQFDKDIHPVRLQSMLKEGLDHLDNLKTMKHITQPQWNLLFPETGAPSSTDFDITLMICLLRNLIPIDIMDRLPSATDTSVGADLSRIKYYRNIIVHSNSALLDDTDFKSYWNDLTPAILHLGGNSLKVECDDWYGKNWYAKQRDDGLQSTQVLALLKKIKEWIESDQEKVPIIELKGHAFNVDEGKSVAIECNEFIFYEKRPPFWEWIHEDDETNKLTIRDNKKDKYVLNSDPPYLRILNAEMSDRGYYRCCIEDSTSNGEEIVRSKKAHLNVEKAVKPGDIHTHRESPVYNINSINTGVLCYGDYIAEGGKFPIKWTAPEALRDNVYFGDNTAKGGKFPIKWPALEALKDNTEKKSALFEELAETNKKQIESEQEKSKKLPEMNKKLVELEQEQSNPVPKNIEEREEKERIDMERKINEERIYKEIEKLEENAAVEQKDGDIETEEKEIMRVDISSSGGGDKPMGKEDSNMLYRLLRPDENCEVGLRAKNPNSRRSVFDHVISRRRGLQSKYISTCGSWEAVNAFRGNAANPIVKIRKDTLPFSVEIIDLRRQENRNHYIEDDMDIGSIEQFNNFANTFQKVLLVGHVPEACIELCDD